MSETPAFAGVPLRDHDVRLEVAPETVARVNREHRERLKGIVAGLTAEEWATPSRCDGWTVQDVVRHLTHINELMLRAIAAARAGERFTEFSTFDPKATPSSWITDAGAESTKVSAAAYARTTDAVVAAADALLAEDADLLVATPAGGQPWPRSLLHALFDTAVHERDLLAPLGRTAEPSADETEAVAAYMVLLSGRILCVLGAPADVALRLDGGPDLRLRVDGPIVAVDHDVDAAAHELTGEVTTSLDAIAGRGELTDALSGPPEAVGLFGALRTLL